MKARNTNTTAQAVVRYDNYLVNLFAHIDFVNRWWKGALINVQQMQNMRSNYLISKDFKRYVFRTATFENFNKIKPGKRLVIVECIENGDIWILPPGWMQHTKEYMNAPITKYSELLDRQCLYSCKGTQFRPLVNAGRIIEINK